MPGPAPRQTEDQAFRCPRAGSWADRLLQPLMPDFLGIGAHRAGSTWLWENLRRHPRVWTPRTKEKHYFDRRWRGDSARARLRYGLFFAGGRLRGRIVGEVTPAYSVLPPARIAAIRAWMPNVKVLLLLRDPVTRAWSHAAKDFRRLCGKPLEEAGPSEVEDFARHPEVRMRGDYPTILKNWMGVFGRDRIFVGFTEEISARLLDDVYGFLGLRRPAGIDWSRVSEPVHVGAKAPLPEAAKRALEGVFYPGNRELETLLGRRLPWG